MKTYIRRQVNAVLGVGFAPSHATQGFRNVKHDEYLEALQDWLHKHEAFWAIPPTFSLLQGLGDRGGDLKVEFREIGYTIIFQVKSHGDIQSSEFTPQMWKQIGQMGSYSHDHVYIILCGDMTDQSHYQKVRLFVDQIEQGNYPHITIISPEQAWRLWSLFARPVDIDDAQKRLASSVAQFLNVLGRSRELQNRFSVLANLQHVYVPPAEYPLIQQVLERNNIVFIVGDPHLGKTMTAVNLLFEYYLQGYQPHWVLSRHFLSENSAISIQELYRRDEITDTFSLERHIRENHILYLEDPFGSTEQGDLDYVSRAGLFRMDQLVALLEARSRTEVRNPKILVTSRASIFRRAVQLQSHLSQSAVWLSTGEGVREDEPVSYDFERRARIMEKYVHLYQPAWMQTDDEGKGEEISELLSIAVSTLWTPHSLQVFFQRSANVTLDDSESIKQCLVNSLDIADSFASEMALLPLIEQLVFVVIYLSNRRATSEDPWRDQSGESGARDAYVALGDCLTNDSDAGSSAWQEVIERYSGIIEQIESESDTWPHTSIVRFRHPSYMHAVSRFLTDHPSVLDDLFDKVPALLRSESGTQLARSVLDLIHHWFQGRPDEEARVLDSCLVSDDLLLLTELADKYSLIYPFAHEPLKTTIQCLVRHPAAAGSTNPVKFAFVRTAHMLTDMPMDQRCDILLAGLAEDPYLIVLGGHRPYDLVCRHFNEVTDQAREHLRRHLFSNDRARQAIARSLSCYFDCLPQDIQEYTTSLASADDTGSFLVQKELIDGIVLGFGNFNSSAQEMVSCLAESRDPMCQAHLASALIPIYDKLNQQLQAYWRQLIQDVPRARVAAAKQVIEMSDIELEMLANSGLLEFAQQTVRADNPFVRAEILQILLDNQAKLPFHDSEQLIRDLVHDDDEVVRAATLYHMFANGSNLRDQFPKRFDDLAQDDTLYARLSKLISFTNLAPDAPPTLSMEVEEMQHVESNFLHNALVFHASAQSLFLPSHWQKWVEEQQSQGNRETQGIVRIGRQHHREPNTRPIFEPNWFLDYADGVQLIWYQPQKTTFETSRGVRIKIKKTDELNLIFHILPKLPDLLTC